MLILPVIQPVVSVKITIDKETTSCLLKYLFECYITCFTGKYDLHRYEPVREALVKNELTNIYLLVCKKVSNNMILKGKQTISITLTHSQRIALSLLFKRLQVPNILESIQFKIINHLIY